MKTMQPPMITTASPQCRATEAEFCLLAGLLPADRRQSRPDQARNLLELMEANLQDHGMTFAHVVRTWFHLDNILDWYGEFNVVRNGFFKERNVYGGIVPASTGVGMPNPAGAAVVGGLLAVKAHSLNVKVMAVPSPLQCPALDYKASFSRAVEVQVPGRRHLYISGTASIDEHGASVHPDDIDAQINLTMAVVEAILKSRNMTWADTDRAIAYCKELRFAPRFTAYCQSHGLLDLPVTIVEATICRGDLLFELELDAVTRHAAP